MTQFSFPVGVLCPRALLTSKLHSLVARLSLSSPSDLLLLIFSKFRYDTENHICFKFDYSRCSLNSVLTL
uniref:Putative ovule protein n=1 Tax=Solanum chacoense TaxID=4108 RepID=A0A0V0H807_SOLCH